MEPRTYNLLTVEDTKFDPDNYGNKYYSVGFENVTGKALWKTKARPESGPVYGHFEKSKSGKATIFKRDQKPEDYVESPVYSDKLAATLPTPQVDVSQPSNAQILNAIEELRKLVLEVLETPAKPQDVLLTPEQEDEIVDDGEPLDLDLSTIPF